MLISKEKFMSVMNELKEMDDASNRLSDALRDYDSTSDFGGFSNFRAMDIAIDLLNILVQDFPAEYVGSTIEYFIYDLEWGTAWTEESITEADGTPVRLSTVEELYDYLAENYSVGDGDGDESES